MEFGSEVGSSVERGFAIGKCNPAQTVVNFQGWNGSIGYLSLCLIKTFEA